ncbi:MAG TPA: hypothetical protein VJV78_45780 [Polyangiales bacterium]|nr:hypothetical protein [Polyangiales bacterium]
MSTRSRTGLVCLAIIFSTGCSSTKTTPRTEVLLQVDADRQIRLESERMTLEISSGAPGTAMLGREEPEVFDLTSEEFRWPASLALIAKPGHEAHAFEVTITVEKGGEALARGRVRSAFLKQQTLLLKTSLFSECIGKLDCGDNQTCVGMNGSPECVDATVLASELPSFDPDQGLPQGGDAADGGGGRGGSGGAESDSGPATDSGADGSTSDSDAATAGDGGAGNGGAGSGGAGQGGAGSDAGPSCVSKGAEQCSNGLDDDCNGDTDCADAACSAMTCAPAGSVTGLLVPSAESCPAGFQASQTTIYQGLTDQGCSGCSCSTTATQCVPHVYYYSTTTACTNDLVKPYTGGTLINKSITETCSSEPIGDDQGMGTPVAWRVTMSTYPGTCSASGSATPLPPVWATTMKLCTTNTRGGGCDSGFVCVPKVSGKKYCSQPSAASCPSNTTQQTWQRGFSDNRSCGLCGCMANGGNCNNVVVRLGHDWGCGTVDGELHGGEKSCSISTYSPPAWMAGSPTNPTCSSSAAVNGSLTATSPLDLCCAN